ncbi:D-cysteine desulfhydrase [Candidatus Formimonas warabiya]|uniref:D-cysteine desulfhydrase n=1 Tax=Formimonas warabiya TaxID=1761012 RepID=A0A3G1KS97_FORW1|nr:D-cysteine desulfhydrase [Candidatus Formimonas warabiya]ATW25339.1 D-cysteine desulfhydrase [Candidatus Formimonas warabiya]
MDLSIFPRRRYYQGPTPIEKLERLSRIWDGPNIFMKRDDTLGAAFGGNKTRKLEFLVAEAIQQGCDTLITCGAVQSNHCRLTLATAVKEGMKCRLVLEERVPGSYHPQSSGNNFLFHLLGVETVTVVPGGTNLMEVMEKEAVKVADLGRKAYIIPTGGSNEVGDLGYMVCAQEMIRQSFDMGITFHKIVVTSGSGGTHSGLLLGLRAYHYDVPVIGISINRKSESEKDLLQGIINKTIAKLDLDITIPREDILVFDEYVGEGYSRPTQAMVDAVDLVAKTEGILLDPVYTGKCMSGLIDLIKKGYFKKGENVLFLHTGGAPSLYAYLPIFYEKFAQNQ